MSSTFIFIVAIVFFVIALNFFMLYVRLKRERHPKANRAAMEEKEAVEWRDREIQRRLDREQEEAVHCVELRNKTLELYEQVRRNASIAEKQDSTVPAEAPESEICNTEKNA